MVVYVVEKLVSVQKMANVVKTALVAKIVAKMYPAANAKLFATHLVLVVQTINAAKDANAGIAQLQRNRPDFFNNIAC